MVPPIEMKPVKSNSPLNVLGVVIALLLLIAAIKIIGTVLFGSELPRSIRDQFANAGLRLKVATWKDLGELRSKLSECLELDEKIMNLEEQLKDAPGPEPHRFWHWFDHMNWATKKHAYDATASKLRAVRNKKNQISDEIGNLASDPKKVIDLIGSIAPLRIIWNTLIAPALHLLLAFGIFRYGLSLILRLVLVNGLVQPTRL